MKINEIIRERRLAKGFTQEQIANYLGVSAPAVNKWEKRNFISRYNFIASTCPTSRYRPEYAIIFSR